MTDQPIFPDRERIPSESDVKKVLGDSYTWWKEIKTYVLEKYPDGVEQWNFPGKKHGWSFRIKDRKRAILYFIPLEGYFKIAFVFGQKAMNDIQESKISKKIVRELEEARVYAEGRGISIDIKNTSVMPDIHRLVEIKLAH